MALYDDLDRHPRITAVPFDPPHPLAAPGSGLTREHVVAGVRLGFLALLLTFWVAGAYAGIVYWSLQGSIWGVIASAVVPGLAATFTWSAFTTFEAATRGRS